MNIKPTILCAALLASSVANATISNGGFENWTNGAPDSWTTVDSGITVSETTNYVENGTSAAQVNVTTTTQASTDLRQTVSVTSGETYAFSVWVYHTEGAVKARLYVDGYQGYSDESSVGEWQELSYNYTASSTAEIEVGLRFYDTSSFDGEEIVYVDDFTPATTSSDSTTTTSDSTTTTSDLSSYYSAAEGLSGYNLKTALYEIISSQNTQSYSDIWDFYSNYETDDYYENDGSLIDIYSESPDSTDSYSYVLVTGQCGNYSGEGDCYNREHTFPQSWFGGSVSPMYTDIHHILPTDGYVNARRSSYPYGEVGTATYTSDNGSLLGSASTSIDYNGTVFEPIDEFKGDIARIYFYMATRYEDDISDWSDNSTYSDAVLDGSDDQVFEDWVVDMLKSWNESDPVSQKELDRNEAAYSFQGNRNPFVDYPDFVNEIWGE